MNIYAFRVCVFTNIVNTNSFMHSLKIFFNIVFGNIKHAYNTRNAKSSNRIIFGKLWHPLMEAKLCSTLLLKSLKKL